MKVYGQLEFAQLENSAGNPAGTPFGRIYIDTTDTTNGIPRFHNGTTWLSFSAAREARLDVASAASITALAATSSLVKLTGSTATSLHGITAGRDNQRLTLINLTGANLTIKYQSGSASAGAQITTMTGADVATTANGAAEFIYDTGSSKWICLWVTA